VVRALGFSLNISLLWPDSLSLGPYSVLLQNLVPDNTTIASNNDISLTIEDNLLLRIELIPNHHRVWINASFDSDDSALEFVVLGDSQGYQGGIQETTTALKSFSPDFLFHCGDLTPFGLDTQYREVSRALDNSSVPVFTTAGNHDVRMDGGSRYMDWFGSSTYSFESKSVHFSIFNTSKTTISESEFQWLVDDLNTTSKALKVVFTHIPPFDPRPGRNHTLPETIASRLMTLFEQTGVDYVFSGHIHMFNKTNINGVTYIITGGAGMSLAAPEEIGGIHHFVRAKLEEDLLLVEPVLLNEPDIPRDMVEVKGIESSILLSLDDLKQLPYREAFSSFQNQFGNWRGQGVYRGVKISDLIDLVGGMSVTDTLTARAYDGYSHSYSYHNVYPNESWQELQGDMILAYQYNGTEVPEWDTGLRIVMLAPDGAYSNEDCLTTSARGMGCNVYYSGGARWVRYVARIEVIVE
jgi:3',5'-cyclic AMP phosphodiesterase CpdA